jgi:hypothetical protein
VESILASVYQRMRSLWEELSSEIQKVKMLIEATLRELTTQLVEFEPPVWSRGLCVQD